MRRPIFTLSALLMGLAAFASPTFGQSHQGGEANLILPDLSRVTFFGGIDGHRLLLVGIFVCLLGLGFGMAIYMNLKKLPVHRAMREISELIYETCKTYLITQGKFILILEIFIGIIIILYFGVLSGMEPLRVAIILAFSLVGIAGSYGVAWFGIRVNTFANSRTAFASLEGKPFPLYAIPLKAGMSIGMMLISVELLIMLCILLFIPGDYAGPCFIGFAIGESLGAAALRIAGGIFTKIADIGADLMKIVFKIKEDDARNPGVIADCTGDNAGDAQRRRAQALADGEADEAVARVVARHEHQDDEHEQQFDGDQQHPDANARLQRNGIARESITREGGKRGAAVRKGIDANAEPSNSITTEDANDAKQNNDTHALVIKVHEERIVEDNHGTYADP